MNIAKKYKTQSDWKKNDGKSYAAACYHKWYSECVRHMETSNSKPWTKERCLVISRLYKKPREWQLNHGASYAAAVRSTWYSECIEHMDTTQRGYWTKEKCLSYAVKHKTPKEWREHHEKSYSTAVKRGWYRECVKHMEYTPNKYWTRERCLRIATKYTTRADWERGHRQSYIAAVKNKPLFDECVSHMESRAPTDNDCLYIWKAVNQYFHGKNVYKIGVTSQRLGTWRIKHVARSHGFNFEIVVMRNIKTDAAKVEKQLLKLGDDPKFIGDGGTEFRAMSDKELSTAISMIN